MITCCRCRYFSGRSRAGFLAAAPGLRGPLGRFAHQLHGHQAGDKFLQADAVKIDRGALGVGLRHDSVSILLVLDALPFGKNLHNCLLICFWHDCGALAARERVRPVRRSRTDGPTFVRLEAGNVLRLQALGAFADLEFNRLPFVERLVSVHLNR